MASDFLIAGNDRKMSECGKRLRLFGFEAKCCEGEDFIKSIPYYENIILPLPTVANGMISYTGIKIQELEKKLYEKQKVFFGNIPLNSFNECGFSYYYNEAFLIKNSRLTAQGVLRIITENTKKDFINQRVAVLGFGRCGKAVCKLLKNCGFNVTSFSRRYESRALAENEGLLSADLNEIDDSIYGFDIIVNTVPFNILSEKCLHLLTQENLYIEIASKPYGFDISKSDIFNFKYVLGESLPGRFTPISAGINIADTVLEILKEGNHG